MNEEKQDKQEEQKRHKKASLIEKTKQDGMNKYKCKSNYKKVGRFNLHVDTGS